MNRPEFGDCSGRFTGIAGVVDPAFGDRPPWQNATDGVERPFRSVPTSTPNERQMIASGVLAYARLRYGGVDRDTLEQVRADLGLPYDPFPHEEALEAFSQWEPLLAAWSLTEMIEQGRIGLLLVADDEHEASLADFVDVDEPQADQWFEAFDLQDGTHLIAPQLRIEMARLYTLVPVATGPSTIQFATVDPGVRPDGEVEPAVSVLGTCERGYDRRTLKQLCLPGTCNALCEPNGWKVRTGPATLTGCLCK